MAQQVIENSTKTKKKTDLRKPRKYHVIFHNDDYTPFGFVEGVLMEVFHKTQEEAQKIATEVHKTGVGIAGTFTHEIAETKVYKVQKIANDSDYPLLVTMEPNE